MPAACTAHSTAVIVLRPLQVGTGRFQWMLLVVLGIANAADAVEIMSVGLLGTAAEEELELTPQRVGALNACIFVGMFLGGIIWGILGDSIGGVGAAASLSRIVGPSPAYLPTMHLHAGVQGVAPLLHLPLFQSTNPLARTLPGVSQGGAGGQ